MKRTIAIMLVLALAVSFCFANAASEAASSAPAAAVEYKDTAIIGFQIVDNGTQQTIGAITEVDDSTENVLFVVDAHHEELLIPASEELITGVDYDSRTIQMNIPEGLI